VACPKTGGQEAPSYAQIVTAGAGGSPTDLIQVLFISKQPLARLRMRRSIEALWQAIFLTPEFEQMGQSLGRFGKSA
jgi:hypothetical protein